MPGVIFPIPTDASGAPEANRWQGTTVEPTLTERIAGHDPYPAPPPAYDVENYARYVQWQNNLRLQASAFVAERQSQTVTLAGATVGNQRRITVNGTNIDYSDTIGQTVSNVADSFALAINSNVTVTAGANAVYAVGNIAGAGTVTILSLSPGQSGAVLVVTVSVLAGAGTITAGALTTPDFVIPSELLGGTGNNIVLGYSADDAGPLNDVRLVLDRNNNAFRAGGTTGAEWDTRSLNSVGIGWRADPQADNSLALGTQAVAVDVADIAIGNGASADNGGGGNDPAIAIGDATATGEGATAVGFGALAATKATAVGYNVSAGSANGTAIGNSSNAQSAGSIAVGYNAVVLSSSDNAIAIGTDAIGSGDNGIAIGNLAIGNQNSIAIGQQTSASGNGAMATGHAETTSDVVATGDGARAHGLGGATVYGITALGTGAEAMGRGSVASGDYSEAMGFGAAATNRGEAARASLGITDIAGPAVEAATHQAGRLVVQCRTPANSTRRFRPDAIDQTTGTTWTPMDDRGYYVRIKVVGKSESSAVSEVFTGEGIVAVDAGTAAVSIVGGLTLASLVALGGGFTTPSVDVAAAGAGITIDAAVGAGLAVRWTAEIEYVQAGINY
jgi:hypothetical protein